MNIWNHQKKNKKWSNYPKTLKMISKVELISKKPPKDYKKEWRNYLKTPKKSF